MSAHNADARALEMGLDLSTNPPLANYVPAVRTGNLVFLSGHGPFQDGELIRGKLGDDLDVDEGYQAARAVMVQLLGSLQSRDRLPRPRLADRQAALHGQLHARLRQPSLESPTEPQTSSSNSSASRAVTPARPSACNRFPSAWPSKSR